MAAVQRAVARHPHPHRVRHIVGWSMAGLGGVGIVASYSGFPLGTPGLCNLTGTQCPCEGLFCQDKSSLLGMPPIIPLTALLGGGLALALWPSHDEPAVAAEGHSRFREARQERYARAA